ncbi:VOC family protein [Nonomuraea soli]|uniref:Catechol 2,3-dioxygenase-like lactoylglutathione lyase family enzyme n=1 Tax=Nonomuraea soli TaxID=1032476 RepID=A0A7W0CNM6_9ACTN|nr:VOC family protein [Nonomuraea soli]MBA2894260.1 catechol 2,3-dioxygenase-like lactoylglutathione lyase family enzyme [Nonomuraea soli]
MSRLTLTGVNIGAPDPHALAAFYAALLGWEISREEEHDVYLSPPDGGPRTLSFQREEGFRPPVWPARPGGQQMMMHLEVMVDDLEAAVARAVSLGATVADFQPQDDVRVCLDPAGHPFCLWLGELSA